MPYLAKALLAAILTAGSLFPCTAALRSEKQTPKTKTVPFPSFRAGKGLDLVVDTQTGAAAVWIDEHPWVSLPEGIKVVGWGPLSLESSEVTNDNEDALFGSYTRCKFVWQDDLEDQHVLETSFLIFDKREMILLEQTFPHGWTRPKDLPYDPDGTRSGIVAGFPSIDTKLSASDIGYMVWGDCFLASAFHGTWGDSSTNDLPSMFNGHNYGQPFVLHDPRGRTMVWSSFDNFMVSGFAFQNQTIQAGLRTDLESIPEKYEHSTLLAAGQGINATLMDWGDVLLTKGGKKRSFVYDDFILAHAGYFTDNGAYHYNRAHEPEYANMEEALLGVKKGFQEQNVPIRYIQWDDWWMESKGDLPGMLSWVPVPDVFPSGFTDWLEMPLSLYAPAYSGENVWIDEYNWKTVNTKKIGGTSSIPLDPKFYMDLFRNGTKIGMKLFEQDFLCSYGIGGSGLTSTDVDSGRDWLTHMDQAAQAFNVTLQLCMPNGYHLLQSTTLPTVTNARATYDNTRNAPSIAAMGPNSLLFHALGIFASRDNVWTSNANVKQEGCGNHDFCYEPNAHLDNAATVLSNGPYGIADGVNYVNRTIVMYGCRTDGWMLRPQWPLGSLDVGYTHDDAKGTKLWAAHDDHGPWRWSYVLGVRVGKVIPITPTRLIQGAFEPASPKQEMVAWKVVPDMPVTSVELFSDESPFMLPISDPLNLPYDITTPPHTHYATAPVLSNGMVLLGEVGKWATMSFGRLSKFQISASGDLAAQLVGAPKEHITFAYIKKVATDTTVQTTDYTFPNSCDEKDQHQNPICRVELTCHPGLGCSFVGKQMWASTTEV